MSEPDPDPEHVLVPIDGSESAWTAFEYVMRQHADGPIVVLHVVDPSEGNYARQAGERPKERSTELLETAVERADAAGVEIETDTTTGSPADAILDYTEDTEIDHVVMGSRGRSGLSRLLLGSVAETVVRRAPVPVTVVREDVGN